MQGKIIVFSAPSGAGKTTIVHRLMARLPELSFSISACTRDRRGRAEENGKDYHFISVQDFQDKIRNDEFVEWEEVYEGAFYGTLKSEIERIWESGKHAILDVDVKGGLSIKEFYKDRALSIFVRPPSICLLYTSPSPRDRTRSRMPSSACKKKQVRLTNFHPTRRYLVLSSCFSFAHPHVV